MGLSWSHILIVLVVFILLFGRNKISDLMGDVAKGIKSFKQGLAEDDKETEEEDVPPKVARAEPKTLEHQPVEPPPAPPKKAPARATTKASAKPAARKTSSSRSTAAKKTTGAKKSTTTRKSTGPRKSSGGTGRTSG